jgi:hypothetical protein
MDMLGKVIQFSWDTRSWLVVSQNKRYRLEDVSDSWHYFYADIQLVRDALAAGFASVISG